MDSGFGINSLSRDEMTSDKFDYWSPIVFENGIKKSYDIELRPQSVGNDGPYEFNFQLDNKKFIDMSTFTINGRMGIQILDEASNKYVRITNENAAKIGLINNCYQSLFSGVTVKINDTEIGDSSLNSYPYSTYLQTLLGTSSSQNINHVNIARGFIKDSGFNMENPKTDVPSTFLQRVRPFKENDYNDFMIELHNDACNMEKYLPPGTKISITLRRSEDDFVLWVAESEKEKKIRIVLEDIHLKVKLLEVNDVVLTNHYKLCEKNPLHIKYTKNVLKTFTSPKGSFDMSHHNLFYGNNLPNRLYIMFVEQEAFNGNITKNPFNFETANVRECSLLVNSIHEPSPPYVYEKNKTEKALYFSFLENTGKSAFELDSVDVSFSDFTNGYFILAFDRSPAKDNGLLNYYPESGQIAVNVKCNQAIEKNYMVVVFASYSEKLIFVEDKVVSYPLNKE